MYEYAQKIWNGKKWKLTYQYVYQENKYSEINNERIVDFSNLSWIECVGWCNNNIEYVKIKRTLKKDFKIKIKIYTGSIFYNGYITITKKNYKKFKVGTIYTKIVSSKDKQQELIDNYIKNN